MNRSLRRRLDDVLDRRVAAAAEGLAGARAQRDAARGAADRAARRTTDEARARVDALRRPPPGPLAGRGEAVARGRARIRALDTAAGAARDAADAAAGDCGRARRALLRALVRRRVVARHLDGVARGGP